MMRAPVLLALLLALLLGALHAAPALAISDPSEALRDPALENRAVTIGRQLRCLVCQNESIEDSGADLARDLRQIVRQRVVAGDDDATVVQYLVARYGDFVRLSPPFNAGTAALWASPVIALLLAAAAVLVRTRMQRPPPAPLSPDEQARLRDLMNP
jgi:cytochrome c-type biogenesis protein CcmH